jgi:hypothetical protein
MKRLRLPEPRPPRRPRKAARANRAEVKDSARARSRVEDVAEDREQLERDHGVAQRLLVLAQLALGADVLLDDESKGERDDTQLAHAAEQLRQLQGGRHEWLRGKRLGFGLRAGFAVSELGTER